MKRYFQLVNLKDEVKIYFFENGNSENIIVGMYDAMRALDDFDLRNYRLFECETKKQWEERRAFLEPIFCGSLVFWIKEI